MIFLKAFIKKWMSLFCNDFAKIMMHRNKEDRDPNTLFTIHSDERQELREEIRMIRQKLDEVSRQRSDLILENQKLKEGGPKSVYDSAIVESIKRQLDHVKNEKATIFIENEDLKNKNKTLELALKQLRNFKFGTK